MTRLFTAGDSLPADSLRVLSGTLTVRAPVVHVRLSPCLRRRFRASSGGADLETRSLLERARPGARGIAGRSASCPRAT